METALLTRPVCPTFAVGVTTNCGTLLGGVESKSQGYANYTMQMVANATGHDVVWNRTGRWLSELSEEDPNMSDAEP